MTTDDIRAAAGRLIQEATIHRVEYGTESQHADDILLVGSAALAGLDMTTEYQRVRHALTAFIHAYANIDRLNHDAVEVELFRAWMEGCGALGIQCKPPERAPGLQPK